MVLEQLQKTANLTLNTFFREKKREKKNSNSPPRTPQNIGDAKKTPLAPHIFASASLSQSASLPFPARVLSRRVVPGLRRLRRAGGAGAGRAGHHGRARAVGQLQPGKEAQAAVPRAAVQGGAHLLQHDAVQGVRPQGVPQASVPGGPQLRGGRSSGREEGSRWEVRPRRAEEGWRLTAASGVHPELQDLLRFDVAVASRSGGASSGATAPAAGGGDARLAHSDGGLHYVASDGAQLKV